MSMLAAAFAPVHQQYLLEARQMQALSFAVHIPLVCFGIAFPAMVLFMEWLGMRTGDPLYRTVARRWSRIVLALFAIGVITGTILSFEMGLLWPNFTATFGSVFGLGFAIEGFSFFMEAIFIGIYAYGWDRLSPRAHFLSGLPIVITGFTGSLTVISVNAWMNHPGGFRLVGGKVVDVDPWGALLADVHRVGRVTVSSAANRVVIPTVDRSLSRLAANNCSLRRPRCHSTDVLHLLYIPERLSVESGSMAVIPPGCLAGGFSAVHSPVSAGISGAASR
jgi:hypothetical protein